MEELYKALQEYFDKFNDDFPTMMIIRPTIEELVDDIRKCIKENKKAAELFKNEIIIQDGIYC